MEGECHERYVVSPDVASMAELLREAELHHARMSQVQRSTIGPPGMVPTSSRGSAERLPTTRPATPRFMSKPAANTHRNRTVMRANIVAGAVFPDYELPDHTNTRRRLGELQGEDPMILTLARGHYCPKEHQQHLELAAFYPKIAVGYTQIATIATDDHHTLQEFRASVGAEWPFLSDPERTVQKDLDIQEYTGPGTQPDDSAHAGPPTRPCDSQHLQRLLVLGTAVDRRSLA